MIADARRLGELLESARARLHRGGIPDARAEAEFLAANVLGVERSRLALEGGRKLTAARLRRLQKGLTARLSRMPLAYVLGSQPFLDLDLAVGPGVFIPRRETEELALAAEAEALRMKRPLRILDLCTGSGALAVALARRTGACVVAIERSARALAFARRNIRSCGVTPAVNLRRGDLFSPLRAGESFDIIVSNPPYVPREELKGLQPEVRREPRAALDGGPGGMAVLERIVAGAPAHLRRGGRLLMELDPAQARRASEAMRGAGFVDVRVMKDLQGRDRIILGTMIGTI